MDSLIIVVALVLVLMVFAGNTVSDGGYLSNITNSIGTAIMGKYSYSQLVTLAQNAGFDDPYTAAAIAMAESGGDPNSYNPETAAHAPVGMGSFGLWQIYRNAHPEFSGWDLYDPQQNAEAAYEIYSASGWNAWSTFKGGQYAQFVQSANEVNA